MNRPRLLSPLLTASLLLAACGDGDGDAAESSSIATTRAATATDAPAVDTNLPQTTAPLTTAQLPSATESTIAPASLQGELIRQAAAVSPTGIIATASTLTYVITGATDGPVDATATLLTPVSDAPLDGWPLMVWAPGSSGLADACATGASADLNGQAAFLAPVVASGVAVVVPNYEGLGTDSSATFRDSESLARATLGAARAAHAVDGISQRYALAGYSMGGQAAIAAAEHAIDLAPDMTLVEVLAIAPAADGVAQSAHFDQQIAAAVAVGDVGQASVLTATKTALLSFLIEGLTVRNSDFRLQDYLGGNAAALASKVTEACNIDLIVAFIGDIAALTSGGAAVTDYQGITDEWFNEPAMAAALKANQYGMTKISVPVTVVHGQSDQIVPNASTLTMIESLQAAGTDVTYITTTAIDHLGQLHDPQAATERDRLAQRLLTM